jgi:hypothetical protein
MSKAEHIKKDEVVMRVVCHNCLATFLCKAQDLSKDPAYFGVSKGGDTLVKSCSKCKGKKVTEVLQ